MAKLSNFKINSNAVRNGEWVRVGEEFHDLEIQTRGYTDQFTDARAARMRDAARRLCAGDVTRLPAAEFRAINIECIIEFCLQDVRNLVDDADAPIGFADFCALLRQADYTHIYEAVLRAVGMVGIIRAETVKAAVGN